MNKDSRIVSLDFGKAIRYYRRDLRGYSLQDMEDLTGISKGYINRLENGKRRTPSVPIARAIARALQMDYKYLHELLDIEKEVDSEDVIPELQEVIMFTDYFVNGVVIDPDGKEILSNIIDLVLTCDWKKTTIPHDIMLLVGKIEEFKEGYSA